MKTIPLKQFEDVNFQPSELDSNESEIARSNDVERTTKSEASNQQVNKLKSNSLTRILRFKGSSTSSNVMTEGESKPSKTRSLFRIFSRKTSKMSVESATSSDFSSQPSSDSLSRSSVWSAVSTQMLPWIGVRRSQTNLRGQLSTPTKLETDDEQHEIATRSEIF